MTRVQPAIAPADLVRSAYRAVELRDLSLLGTMLAADVAWYGPPGPAGHAAQLLGRDAVLSRLTELVERSGGRFTVRLQRLYADPGRRVVAFHEIARRTGSPRTECMLYEIRDGRVRRAVSLAPMASGPP